MQSAYEFFYEHAGYSYNPAAETEEQGRRRGAKARADAELQARLSNCSFKWEIDPDIDSSEWSDEMPPCALWGCKMYDENGEVVASLWGIDFGRDGSPWGDPYRRVVETELALEWAP